MKEHILRYRRTGEKRENTSSTNQLSYRAETKLLAKTKNNGQKKILLTQVILSLFRGHSIARGTDREKQKRNGLVTRKIQIH